jgi:hypothetical protein
MQQLFYGLCLYPRAFLDADLSQVQEDGLLAADQSVGL